MAIAIDILPLDAAREVLLPILRDADPAHALIAAKCLGLLTGYAARWQNSPYRIDDVEAVITSDLYNAETEHKSRTFTVAGKIDVRATEINTGARVIFDHKTTSQDISDPDSTFWRQLVIEGQVSHYMLLEWLNGHKVDYAIWDVVRKPGISPKLLSKKDCETVIRFGTFYGTDLARQDRDELAATGRETLNMYAARLAVDCIAERPEWYFQRRSIPRLDTEIREYAAELWDHSQEIILARRHNRHPRNSGACMTYNSPCQFLGICSGYDTPDSDKWTRKAWVHPELPILDGDGKEVLTNSRIRTFQTCRRKHQLQYEIGIERIDEEEKEALFFGTLWHSALEQFFLALKSQQERN